MKYSKTDDVIFLIQYLSKNKKISKHKLIETLKLPRSSFYRNINEFLSYKGRRKPILIEFSIKNITYYKLHDSIG